MSMPIDTHLLLLYLVTTLVAAVAPGPDMLFVLGIGMRNGPRAGLLATTGIATSEIIHVTLAAAGLSAFFAAVPVAFTTFRIAGGAYLIYLGIQAIRHRGTDNPTLTGTTEPVSGRQAYLRGLLTNLLNPKMVTFSVAFLPQFVNPKLGLLPVQFAILGTILIAFEFLIDGTVGILAGRIGTWLTHRRTARKRIDIATGSLFISLGLRLAADR